MKKFIICLLCSLIIFSTSKESLAQNTGFQVQNDGSIVTGDGLYIGKIVNNELYDAQGNLLGKVNNKGEIFNSMGSLVGSAKGNGDINNNNGSKLMNLQLQQQKQAKSLVNAKEQELKALRKQLNVSNDGSVRDKQGNILAQMGTDGVVRDSNGHMIFKLNENGTITNSMGQTIMKVQKNGDIIDAQGNVYSSKNILSE